MGVAVCACGHVAFNANDIYVDNIYRLIRATVAIPARDSMKIPIV